MKLVATHQFASYQPGEEITDSAEIQRILHSDHAQFVVKVAAADPVPAVSEPKKRAK